MHLRQNRPFRFYESPPFFLRLPWNRAGHGPSGLARFGLPRFGMQEGVSHLRELLPGTGVLRG